MGVLGIARRNSLSSDLSHLCQYYELDLYSGCMSLRLHTCKSWHTGAGYRFLFSDFEVFGAALCVLKQFT